MLCGWGSGMSKSIKSQPTYREFYLPVDPEFGAVDSMAEIPAAGGILAFAVQSAEAPSCAIGRASAALSHRGSNFTGG